MRFGLRGYRLEAVGLALSVGRSPDWLKFKNPNGTSGPAGGGRGLGQMINDDPMAAVREYVDAFNRGDTTAMAPIHAVSGSILDGMAPHLWQGPTATHDWYMWSSPQR